jgi:outer membrane protein OmpA-like peptidoglycan-associated protein
MLHRPNKQLLRGTIRGIIIDSNGKQLNPQIFRVNNIISSNITALMNNIFFDPGSVEIPKRYIQLSPNETERFELSVLDGAGTLGVYYQILNVLAKRMITDPTSTISLTGCLSGSESEKDQIQLAQQRAENVKTYLTSVWQIDPKRIKVQYRNLPENHSNTNNEDGFAENRRVEITSNSQSIFSLLSFMDTTRTTNIAAMNISARAQSEGSIEEWNIVISQGNKTLKEFTDIGEIPSAPLVWNINEDKGNIPRGKGLLSLTLFARDREGKKIRIDGSPIVVEQLYNQKDRIVTFSLITFKYNESTVDESNMAIVELIKSRLDPRSIVTIEGYTDRTGNPDYNLKLSDSRAKEVARLLKLPSDIAVGKGNNQILYNNDLPEGRIYSRTVRVTIETPIE